MDKLSELLRDMRAHRTDHGRQTSDTVRAWADRLESALGENLVLRRDLVDQELLNWLEREWETLAREQARRRLLVSAEEALRALDPSTPSI